MRSERRARPEGMAAYLVVTAAYWAFMLSDGALRMLVLLHFHALGFSPVQLAYLFLLYEAAGIVANLSAGWIGARFGLAPTLYAGLALQVAALSALTLLDPAWTTAASVAFAMACQGAAGIAKDLTKTGAKSAVKLLAPEGALFGWVAVLTGSKNAVKGLGFLLGAGLLATVGFTGALWGMAAALAAILVASAALMPPGLPKGDGKARFREAFSTDPDVNRLSLARVFLFAARDAWFVVGVPVFFYSVLSDGTAEGDRAAFFLTGTFLAGWIVLYGAVQAAAPRLLRAQGRSVADTARAAFGWAGALAVMLAAMAGLAASGAAQDTVAAGIAAGLLAFGGVFAVNSSLHSYLILGFASAARVTRDVGFYYMSNAAGRLLGTLASGLGYQFGGLWACLALAAAFAAISAAVARGFRGDGGRAAA